MVLDEILDYKRKDLEALKRRIPFAKMRAMCEKFKYERRSLLKALSDDQKLHLICELKKASPSEGVLRKRFQPTALAKEFEAAKASAISVLTEPHYFMGDPGTIKKIRPMTHVPLLRKDFIFDPYQVYETVVLKADAFLLIVMLLTDFELKQLLGLASELKLDVLVEVHTQEELKRALSAGSKMIGINNRNLKTLKIDRSISEHLISLIPKGKVAVIESGIETAKEIEHYQSLGARSFLIGTTLMKSKNVTEKIRELSAHELTGVKS